MSRLRINNNILRASTNLIEWVRVVGDQDRRSSNQGSNRWKCCGRKIHRSNTKCRVPACCNCRSCPCNSGPHVPRNSHRVCRCNCWWPRRNEAEIVRWKPRRRWATRWDLFWGVCRRHRLPWQMCCLLAGQRLVGTSWRIRAFHWQDQRENNNKAITLASCNIEPLKIPWAPGNVEEVSTSMKAQQPEPEIAAR